MVERTVRRTDDLVIRLLCPGHGQTNLLQKRIVVEFVLSTVPRSEQTGYASPIEGTIQRHLIILTGLPDRREKCRAPGAGKTMP